MGYTYETDNTPDKRNTKVTLPFNVEQKFAYDGLGRTREVTLGENLVKDIYYQKFGDHATNRVSTVWYGVNGIRKDSLKYTYDKAGNITSICENGVVIARYVYDGLNRLICENNSQFNQKIKYEYDHAGNIVCKSVNGQKYKYSYPISGWRDQLLSYNGEECEYDAIGNPIKYRNRNLVWQGRRLKSISSCTSLATYTYDANNVRTSKTVTDEAENFTCKFIYDGNTLIAEQRNGTWIYYIYGVDGIAGFKFDGKVYLYRKNIQGDVTHIYEQCEDGSLNQVAHYAYDAFGNFRILHGEEDENSIANINPFRYRGYYYDTETGLYYLISRYYDPETCRFISADSIEYLDPETLGGLNLYAYCCNNPVMMTDEDGTKPGFFDWFVSTALCIGGALLCLMPGAQGLGAALLISGVSMTVSNAMSAAGVNGKLASIISSGLDIGIGIALCFTPLAGLGASLIGSGVVGLAGGYISEACGYKFETGAAIGSIIGSVLGAKIYGSIKIKQLAHAGTVVLGEGMTNRVIPYANKIGATYYKGMPGFKSLSTFLPKCVMNQLGLAHNATWIRWVSKAGVNIVNLGPIGNNSKNYIMEILYIMKWLF